MGKADDECRTCTWCVFNLLDPTVMTEAHGSTMAMNGQGRSTWENFYQLSVLPLLFSLLWQGGHRLVYRIVYDVGVRTLHGKFFDRDHDAITVGKDSIAALVYFLCLCIIIVKEEGLRGIALYQMRFKLLEDGGLPRS